MTRHYLEGLLAALCASALFVLSVRRPPGPAATMLAVAGATSTPKALRQQGLTAARPVPTSQDPDWKR